MGFKVYVEEDEDQIEGDHGDNLTEYIVFLEKIFGKDMRRLDRR